MSDNVKNKADEKIERTDILYGLPCALSRKALCDVSIELVKTNSELECLEFLKTEMPGFFEEEGFDSKVKMASVKRKMLENMLDSDQGIELTPCERIFDYSKKRVRVYRNDTGEVVKDRAMTAEDRAIMAEEWPAQPRTRQKSLLPVKSRVDNAKNKSDKNIVMRNVTMRFPHKLSRRHLCETVLKYAEVDAELNCLKFLKTEMPGVYGKGELDSRIEATNKNLNLLDKILASGEGTELVPCKEVVDYSVKNVRITRCNNGRVIENRAMTAEEWRARRRAVRVSKPRTRKKVLLQGKAPAAAHQLAASAS
jgi:hypothetical protein